MFDRQRIGVVCLLVTLPLAVFACGREGRFPTAATPTVGADPNLDARDDGMLETLRGRGHQHLARRAIIAEAKEALGAVLTGEQIYFQQWATFTDVSETADLRVALGVYLGDLVRRWAFSVSGTSVTGFVAVARGRAHTKAQGIVVTLRYVRNQPPVWTVQWRR